MVGCHLGIRLLSGLPVGYLTIVRVVAYNTYSFLLQLGAVLGSTIEDYNWHIFFIASCWEKSLGTLSIHYPVVIGTTRPSTGRGQRDRIDSLSH